ncbi:MAG TPA: aminotransferase [Rhizomicrobium sp.]|jgi:aspartate/methionine/tyrosine aminotransferase|nr:aminotransferase [Rhizomicrobium sp.]
MSQTSKFNPVFASLPTTIFTVMSALAVEHGAVNLGQGFPDEDGPRAIRDAAAKALIEGPNQYPPTRGRIELRRAVAGHAKRFYGLNFSADTDVLVTSGGTEALTASIMGLAGPGGEVVLIEPAYDSYRPIAEAAGAKVKSISLAPPDWRLNADALAAAITPDTRVVMLNSPLNPIGRAFTREELEGVARVIAKSNAVVICDEVYEHLIFDGREHIPLITLPGMRERVVKVGSAGKMFSLTGWKVGWVAGAAPLIDVIAKAHQFLTFTTPPGLQLGIAYALDHEMDFTLGLTKTLQSHRDLLAEALPRFGFRTLPCEGSYFLTADISGLTNEPDVAFCERLVKEAGVAMIPLSVFFSGGKPNHLVRFAFCKKREVIQEAIARLEKYFGKTK